MVDAGRFQERSKVAGLHGLEDAPRALPRSPMPRLRWPDSTNSVSDVLTWAGFYAVCGINLLFLLMHWNSWVFQGPLRFVALVR